MKASAVCAFLDADGFTHRARIEAIKSTLASKIENSFLCTFMQVKVGDRVSVFIGEREVPGIVAGITNQDEHGKPRCLWIKPLAMNSSDLEIFLSKETERTVLLLHFLDVNKILLHIN